MQTIVVTIVDAHLALLTLVIIVDAHLTLAACDKFFCDAITCDMRHNLCDYCRRGFTEILSVAAFQHVCLTWVFNR